MNVRHGDVVTCRASGSTSDTLSDSGGREQVLYDANCHTRGFLSVLTIYIDFFVLFVFSTTSTANYQGVTPSPATHLFPLRISKTGRAA